MWFRKHKKERITWPTPEVDYEGNDLWALRLAKPVPISIELQRLYAGMQQSAMAQQAAACAYYGPFYRIPCNYSPLGNYLPW